MKRILYPLAVLAFGATLTAAHADNKAQDSAPNSAVKMDNSNNPGAPVDGANSFTEAQARERIAEKGFSDVSALVKDENGIWRGKAAQGGVTHDVAVDYQGNVTHK